MKEKLYRLKALIYSDRHRYQKRKMKEAIDELIAEFERPWWKKILRIKGG